LAALFALPNLTHLWTTDSETLPAPEHLAAHAEEARALVSEVGARWTDLLARIDETFPSLQDHSTLVSWKTELKGSLDALFEGRGFEPVRAKLAAIHRQILRSRVFIALHMHA